MSTNHGYIRGITMHINYSVLSGLVSVLIRVKTLHYKCCHLQQLTRLHFQRFCHSVIYCFFLYMLSTTLKIKNDMPTSNTV